MNMQIPWQCQEILDRFAAHHVQAYLVGGCVRDSLLGKTPKDWDICTEALPDQVREIFKEYKVILTGLQHGTVTVLLGGLPIEITTYRIDGEYEDNRHPKEVFFTSNLQEDLSRRDFTINALAYHPEQGVIDYFHGMEDLQQGIIRCVGDAASRYQEDGLRIMRAVRFACVLNFQFEAETEAAIRKYSYLLRNIARERIQVEFDKILTSSWAAYGLETLARLDCFPYFLPELCHTWQFAQQGGRHSYDVFTHTVKAVALAPSDVVLRLTMLLHDIGKPFAWKMRVDGADIFPDHEEIGAELAGKILNRLRYDKKTISRVTLLVRNHTRQLQPEDVNLRQAVADLGAETVQQLLEVKRADIKAHSDSDITEILQLFDNMEEMLQQILQRGDCCTLKQLALSGKDLIALGYKGQQVGQILDQLLQVVIQQPEKNDKAYLLEWVKGTKMNEQKINVQKQIEMIQSEQNQWLKRCKALQQKKYRQQYGQFVAEGLRFVQEALENDSAEIILLDEAQQELLAQLAVPERVSVFVVKAGLLEKALSTMHPQGVAAIARQRQWHWEDVAQMKQILVIDGVQDPGNLGTIIRTALASGTEAVLCLKGTVDLYNDKVLRSTMGAIFRIPIYQIADAQEMQDTLHQWGFELLVADIRAKQYYYEMQFPEKAALVVSNEANGPQLIKTGDQMVKIPLYQQAESLNVAVATGILLYAIRTGREG